MAICIRGMFIQKSTWFVPHMDVVIFIVSLLHVGFSSEVIDGSVRRSESPLLMSSSLYL